MYDKWPVRFAARGIAAYEQPCFVQFPAFAPQALGRGLLQRGSMRAHQRHKRFQNQLSFQTV